MNDIFKDGHDQQCTNLTFPQNDEKLVHWYTKDKNHAKEVVKTQCTNLESECDLRNQEGADRFRAQVEKLGKEGNQRKHTKHQLHQMYSL